MKHGPGPISEAARLLYMNAPLSKPITVHASQAIDLGQLLTTLRSQALGAEVMRDLREQDHAV